MSKRDIDGKKIAIFLLVLLLIVAVGYISFVKFADWRQTSELGTFQQGAQYGYQQAFVDVANAAVTCQQVPLTVGNQTINIIAVECLNQ
ncbi:MAG: hypothetical protein KKF67_03340 [Nanoarchaeota archaeon]|nr:hypothetical protein [Nanoarchaeota archaeon]